MTRTDTLVMLLRSTSPMLVPTEYTRTHIPYTKIRTVREDTHRMEMALTRYLSVE